MLKFNGDPFWKSAHSFRKVPPLNSACESEIGERIKRAAKRGRGTKIGTLVVDIKVNRS